MKTKEEILEQLYVTPEDLMILMPALKYGRALTYINETQKEMQEKNIFVPASRPKMALTKLIRKKFGF